jgi:hypothetical protein
VRWKYALASALVIVIAATLLAVLLYAWVLHPVGSNTNPCESLEGCPGSLYLALSPASEQGVPGEYWYNFSVESAQGGLTLGELGFRVQTPTGQTIALANASLEVLGPGRAEVGSYDVTTNEWTSGGSTPMTNQQLIVLRCSNDLSSQGNVFVVLGSVSSGYSGSVTVSIP